MSYCNYLREEDGLTVIENEAGFIAWNINGEEAYVHSLYVKPELRGNKEALKLANEMMDKLEGTSVKRLTCNVYCFPHNKKFFMRKIKLYSEFGFDVLGVYENVVTLIKEL